MKPKFDGYAAQYDAWFMTNENLFQSELRLFMCDVKPKSSCTRSA